MKFPNIKPGQAVCGAEWYGCSNTFRRAKMTRLLDGTYVVGYESDLQTALNVRSYLTRLLDAKRKGKRTFTWTERKAKYSVHMLKTRAAAVKKFAELNQTVLDFNAEQRDRAAKAAAAWKRGNVTEAMKYTD